MDSFRRVNVISLNWAYMKNMKFTLKEWLKLLATALNHKCEPGSCFNRPEELAERNSSKQLWISDRISRIYYTNRISFDRCFGSWTVDVRKAKEKEHRPSVLRWLLGLVDDRRDWFVAKPAHRINPQHAFYLITIFVGLFASFCVINTTILFARLDNCISCLKVSVSGINGDELGSKNASLDCSNITGFQEIVLIMIETFITESLIDINICDSLMFFFSSMIHYSRTMRVVEMLKGQFEIYDQHRRYKFSDRKIRSAPMAGSYESSPLYDFRFERGLSELYDRSNFNSNIDYSLNLCDVLISEFGDLRKQFSFYLSMNTVLSTFSSAYSVIMILSSNSTAELIAIWGRLYTCVVPLLISLLLGALVEFGVSSQAALALNRT